MLIFFIQLSVFEKGNNDLKKISGIKREIYFVIKLSDQTYEIFHLNLYMIIFLIQFTTLQKVNSGSLAIVIKLMKSFI